MKKIRFSLVVVLFLCMLAFAACGGKEATPGLEFKLINNDTYEVSKGSATAAKIIIPEKYNGLPVTAIAKGGFAEYLAMTDIIIPNSVKEIGDYAFAWCSSLKSVTLPNSVTSIGYYAFIGCSGLTGITIPKSVKKIGTYAFVYCNLESIVVKAGNKVYRSEGNCLIDISNNELIQGCKNSKIPNGIKEIGYYAFARCSGLKNITIPNSVTSIGAGAFEECSSLTSIIIPNSATSIGDGAFQKCSGLKSITIPSSVTNIGKRNILAYCSNLESITVESGNKFYRSEGNCLMSIEDKTLITGCKNSVIPSNIIEIGFAAFAGCSGLTSITIPNGVEKIDYYSFSSTGLTSITIPKSIKNIGRAAFSFCSNLVNITVEPENPFYKSEGNCLIKGNGLIAGCKYSEIPDGVTSIEAEAFAGSSLTGITIPKSVTRIEEAAFFGCSDLASLVILNGVKFIGNNSFENCNSLTNVVIPNSVTAIWPRAFAGCGGLTSIIIPNSVQTIGGAVFINCHKLVIYAEAVSQPSGWGRLEFPNLPDNNGIVNWNPDNCAVMWGYTID